MEVGWRSNKNKIMSTWFLNDPKYIYLNKIGIRLRISHFPQLILNLLQKNVINFQVKTILTSKARTKNVTNVLKLSNFQSMPARQRVCCIHNHCRPQHLEPRGHLTAPLIQVCRLQREETSSPPPPGTVFPSIIDSKTQNHT